MFAERLDNLANSFSFFPARHSDFRVNKYCGEYLTIGNEIWPDEDHNEVSDEHLAEPVAEARVHLESNFHQFTNLKIIKAEPNDDSHAAASPRARNNAELKMLKVLDKEKNRNKVYSQVI